MLTCKCRSKCSSNHSLEGSAYFQGDGDLKGVLLKIEDEIYVIDVKSEMGSIKKLILNENSWTSEFVSFLRGEPRANAAVAAAHGNLCYCLVFFVKCFVSSIFSLCCCSHFWEAAIDEFCYGVGNIAFSGNRTNERV